MASLPRLTSAILETLSDADGTSIERVLGRVHTFTRGQRAQNNAECRDFLRYSWYLNTDGTLTTEKKADQS